MGQENEGKTILVVEDERPLLEAISKKLSLNGFTVVTARTTAQAIAYMEDLDKVDAVWLDHYLFGKESGLDFVAFCKTEGSLYKHIPFFVVSNTASADKVQSYMRLGVNKYYTKSDFRLDQIVGDITTYLTEHPNGD